METIFRLFLGLNGFLWKEGTLPQDGQLYRACFNLWMGRYSGRLDAHPRKAHRSWNLIADTDLSDQDSH